MALCSRQKGELAWIGGGEGLVRGERRRVLVGCDRGQRRERGVERARPRDPQETMEIAEPGSQHVGWRPRPHSLRYYYAAPQHQRA